MNKKWWMESVGYQVYPKSFFDSNHDGIGDIKGIMMKLPYLKKLGVDIIWIGPFFKSPMDDNGYDVSDYLDVHHEFGKMDDVQNLINECQKLNIKIILDFVLNHTSDEHQWFIEAKKSKSNAYRDYYIWADGRNGDIKEPTNWGSFFGGSAWAYDEGSKQYYMKIFSNRMPDLNWKNDKVIQEMVKIGSWWLERGVSGFRIDAVSHLAKAALIDTKPTNEIVLDWFKFSNLPETHRYLKILNQELFSKYDCLTIGEVGGSASIDQGLKYAGFDQNELSMVFNFDHNWCNNLWQISHYDELQTNVKDLKNVFIAWQTSFKDKGWLPLNWLNHDQPRLASQYGSRIYPLASLKALATMIHMLKGTPFIYQGEEIGMTNYPFTEISEFREVASMNKYHEIKDRYIHDHEGLMFELSKSTRDHARTPMQWNAEKHAGFSKYLPWINVNPNYLEVNVENNLKDSNSLFYYYQKLIQLRKSSAFHDIITWGDFINIELNDDIFSYYRTFKGKRILVIVSLSHETIDVTIDDITISSIIINNYENLQTNHQTIKLQPFQSVVLDIKETL